MEDDDKKILEVFEKLGKKYTNLSFVYSYVYAKGKDVVYGRANMRGSKEEVETHIVGLSEMVDKEIEKGLKKKGKIYEKNKLTKS